MNHYSSFQPPNPIPANTLQAPSSSGHFPHPGNSRIHPGRTGLIQMAPNHTNTTSPSDTSSTPQGQDGHGHFFYSHPAPLPQGLNPAPTHYSTPINSSGSYQRYSNNTNTNTNNNTNHNNTNHNNNQLLQSHHPSPNPSHSRNSKLAHGSNPSPQPVSVEQGHHHDQQPQLAQPQQQRNQLHQTQEQQRLLPSHTLSNSPIVDYRPLGQIHSGDSSSSLTNHTPHNQQIEFLHSPLPTQRLSSGSSSSSSSSASLQYTVYSHTGQRESAYPHPQHSPSLSSRHHHLHRRHNQNQHHPQQHHPQQHHPQQHQQQQQPRQQKLLQHSQPLQQNSAPHLHSPSTPNLSPQLPSYYQNLPSETVSLSDSSVPSQNQLFGDYPGLGEVFHQTHLGRLPDGTVVRPCYLNPSFIEGDDEDVGMVDEDGNILPQQQIAAVMKKALVKTELCLNFSRFGHCAYGPKCFFAHGLDEVRTKPHPATYKSQPCPNPVRMGTGGKISCPYGARCHFSHPYEPLRRVATFGGTVCEKYFDEDYTTGIETDFGDEIAPWGVFV